MNLARIRSYVATSLWVLPAIIVVMSAAAAFAVLSVDGRVDTQTRAFVYSGGPESARQILGTISGAMITFTGLVFSITILVLQLASSQYSPRVLRSFFRDRSSKVALGIFTGTFTYSLIVLREVRAGGAADVPGFSVTVAVLFVLVAVGMFVHYLNHIARAIQVTSILKSVAAETHDAIESRYTDERTGTSGAAFDDAPVVQRIAAPRSGVVVRVDEEALIARARDTDTTVVLEATTGDFVPYGSEFMSVHGASPEPFDDPRRIAEAVELADERSTEQDPAFGIRQLVDIAERALSTGVNDPTTAVPAIDHLHDLLRRLVVRPFPQPERRDEDGVVRLVVPEVPWERYVEMAVVEIRRSGASSLQVHRRLRALLQDLLQIAPEERRAPLRRELQLLDASATSGSMDGDVSRAMQPDRQGFGTADPRAGSR